MIPIIFCCDSFDVSIPHPMWNDEVKIASSFGQIYLLDHEALLRGKVEWALRRIPQSKQETVIIYHGWMMIPSIYEKFYDGLKNKGYRLINTPTEYLGCHHISNWYPVIKESTPKTIVVRSDNVREILNQLHLFGDSSIIIKDFVSSQKHSWKEACFIPSGKDIVEAAKIITTFITMQSEVDGIQGGIVLREFVPLLSTGKHPKSEMPLSQEFRAFILDGKIISLARYWEYGDYAEGTPPRHLLNEISNKVSKKIKSRFFTIDLAQKVNGDWICIEVGDGQVSSLPELGDKKEFYSKLMVSSR